MKNIFILKITSFKMSKSFNSVAQGVLEIFEEVCGGGGAMCPPVGRGLILFCCYGNQWLAEAFEKYFSLKITSFELSESFNSVRGGLQLPNFSENPNNVRKWVGGVNACSD